MSTNQSPWAEEIREHGLYEALRERMRTVGSIDLEMLVICTGVSVGTLQPMMARLVDEEVIRIHPDCPSAWTAVK